MAATETTAKKKEDIASLVATLASRQAQQTEKPSRTLTGPERAAVIMLALGEQYGGKIWSLLDDDELRQLSIVMSTLGTIDSSLVENLLLEFVGRLDRKSVV